MKKCFPIMLPAQESLLLSNHQVDSKTKQRYYQFLSKHVSGFEVYEQDDKMISSASTAITWLIARTRDVEKFPLIAEENINFGFSYNLLGLKPIGIGITTIGMIFNIILFYLDYRNIIAIKPESIISGIIVNLLFLLLWTCIVTKKLVISCGEKYARALLSACDSTYLNEN